MRRIEGDASRVTGLAVDEAPRRPFDFFILAVPWRAAGDSARAAAAGGAARPGSRPAISGLPITAVHLCFDRPIMPWDHAVLVGRLSQWIFHISGSPCLNALRGVPQPAEKGYSRFAERRRAVPSERDELLALRITTRW